MTVYATRLANASDTRDRLRRADAAGFFPSGPGLARGGFRPDGGGVVTVNAGAMTVNVSPFTAWVDGGASDLQGGYTFACDTTEVLAVADGHGSLSRTDVVIAEVRDTTHDASGFTDARVRIVQGTAGGGVPVLPTNALALRNITVPAGLSAGNGGLSAGNLSTDRRTYTTGLGGVLTVASQAERDALPATRGTVVYRSDTDTLEVRRASGWQTYAPLIKESLEPGAGGFALASNVTASGEGVELYRRGDMAYLSLFVLTEAGHGGADMVSGIPTEWRPERNARGLVNTSSGVRPITVQPSDGRAFLEGGGVGVGAAVYGYVTWAIA